MLSYIHTITIGQGNYMKLTELYCDVFGQIPSLLCNRKLDTPVVARQPEVKHLHGYARE
jgi:hypothetical protein